MNWLATAIPTGVTAFVATNLDDLIILTLLFSQANATFRRRHIVFGQYLGFMALLIASLPGFFGRSILPHHLIGLLGLVPIAMGLSRLLNPENDASGESKVDPKPSEFSPLQSLLSPQVYSVAAITVANGSDNIGIYVPLFANSEWKSLLVIVAIFLSLVGVWCYATYKLTLQPAIAPLLTRYGNYFVPYVLIGLGVAIVLDSNALTPLALAGSCFCLMGLVKDRSQPTEVENN
ncbi:cadmium resistance transporter [Pseudanabaena sp. PCC 6802]|uniref:cadmium resistance transporter n=1 Tax=Pseudanabaena sp. PCC 6802 TaxID=118173 RepID=UPI000379CA1E|nr:cadmium resistance transporter [Pseudanabaena sp. PCC 6802]